MLLQELPLLVEDELPQLVVVFPLDYPRSAPPTFDANFTHTGGFLRLTSALFDVLSHRLVGGNTEVVLTPVAAASPLLLTFRSLRIRLPNPVYNPSCYTLLYDAANDRVLLDLITTDGLLASVAIRTADFVVAPLPAHPTLPALTLPPPAPLDLTRYAEWGHCLVPYAFDIRAPLLLVSVDPHLLVVALDDGGVVFFLRDYANSASWNGLFVVENFSDTSSLLVLRLFGLAGGALALRLQLARQAVQLLVRQARVFNKDADEKAVYAVAAGPSTTRLVFALTLDNRLKVFSLDTMALVACVGLHDIADVGSVSLLGIDPFHPLASRLVHVEEDGSRLRLLVVLPGIEYGWVGQFELAAPEDHALVAASLRLPQWSTLLRPPTVMAAAADTSSNESHLWAVQDVAHVASHLVVVWALGLSLKVQQLAVGAETQQHDLFLSEGDVAVGETGEEEAGSIGSGSWRTVDDILTNENMPDFMLERVFALHRYSRAVVEELLRVFSDFYLSGAATGTDTSAPLRARVVLALNASLVNSQDVPAPNKDRAVREQCSKFDLLCQQFQKRSRLPVAVHVQHASSDEGARHMVILRGYDYSVVRPVDEPDSLAALLRRAYWWRVYASLAGPHAAAELLELERLVVAVLELLLEVRRQFGRSVMKLFKARLVDEEGGVPYGTNPEHPVLAQRIDAIYNHVFKDQVPAGFLQLVLQRLDAIPKLDQVLEYLTKRVVEAPDTVVDALAGSGVFGKAARWSATLEVSRIHASVVLELLVLMVITDTNPDVCGYFLRLIRLFHAHQMLGVCVKVGLVGEAVEGDSIAGPAVRLMVVSSTTVTALLALLSRVVQRLLAAQSPGQSPTGVLALMASPLLLNYAVSELLAGRHFRAARDCFGYYLGLSPHPMHRFLLALVHCHAGDGCGFLAVCFNHASEIRGYLPDKHELDLIGALSQLYFNYLSLFNTNEAEYFHQLGRLASLEGYVAVALRFELAALASLDEGPAVRAASAPNGVAAVEPLLPQELLLNIFQLLLKNGDFERAYHALQRLYTPNFDSKVNHSNLTLYELAVQFVTRVFASGDLQSLVQLPLARDWLLFDRVLSLLADLEQAWPPAVRLYQVLYSLRLRHGDTRGACEALYRPITRWSTEHVHDTLAALVAKVVELYVVMLNLLQTVLDAEERWVVRVAEGENQVVEFGELQRESAEWHSRLERVQ